VLWTGVARSCLGGLGLLALWLAALQAQQYVERTPLAWAGLDAVAHGAAAGLVAVGLIPGFGARTLVWGIAAGILLDLDHAVAARSLDPLRMMSLTARPPTHSLVAALALAGLVGSLRGWIFGYVVGIGIIAHLLGDAIEPAGVPLLAPFIADPWMRVSVTTLVFGMLAMGLVSTGLSLSHALRRSATPRLDEARFTPQGRDAAKPRGGMSG
jgi:membrane-bound metal-dependent hydrolase YbcI (DUF457 family)